MRDLLLALFDAAIGAADPYQAVQAHLPTPPKGRTLVIGAGKAAARMAQAVEATWPAPLTGLVVVPHGQRLPLQHIETIEAAHPMPDEAGLEAARRTTDAVRDLGPDDLVIALISGGGSALLPAPAPGLTLADEQAVNRALLGSGMPIAQMNRIRTAISTLKGGRLAALAAPARVATLIVSDIPGDDPALVASGPTVPLVATGDSALVLAERFGLDLPPAVWAVLRAGRSPAPDPADPRFAGNSVAVIASAAVSLEAGADHARAAGYTPMILSDAIEGEARDIAGMHAAIARQVLVRDRPFAKPVAILSGGETTVTLRGSGKGGRNSEFMLAFALAIEGLDGIAALSADTDGVDGTGGHAGAWADGTSAARIREAGIDPAAALAANNSHAAFAAIDGLVVTGPTGTNVNDFRAILVR